MEIGSLRIGYKSDGSLMGHQLLLLADIHSGLHRAFSQRGGGGGGSGCLFGHPIADFGYPNNSISIFFVYIMQYGMKKNRRVH